MSGFACMFRSRGVKPWGGMGIAKSASDVWATRSTRRLMTGFGSGRSSRVVSYALLPCFVFLTLFDERNFWQEAGEPAPLVFI